uniref:Tubby N-terminal domain-containing protein n=1 Tax=Balaenoptera musculus TaxID=9771 RepID=A0A8C0DIV4_BALMU
MEVSRYRPGPRGDSAFEDESMKLRQLKLDNQTALLEKKQRKKRPEPLVAQPNPEARPRGSKPRGSEGHAPLVEPHAPPSGVILHGSDGPAALLKPDAQDVETRLHVLSVGSSAREEDTEGSADGDSTWDPASKPDLQEILQKHALGLQYPTPPSLFLYIQVIYELPSLAGFTVSAGPHSPPLLSSQCRRVNAGPPYPFPVGSRVQ